MSTFKVIKESEFVKLDMQGVFDFDQTLTALKEIIGRLDKDALNDLLFDLMDSKCGLSELDIYQIAEFMEDNVRLFKGRIALLLGSTIAIDNSRFLKFCIQDPAIRVRIFFDMDVAKQWLASPSNLA